MAQIRLYPQGVTGYQPSSHIPVPPEKKPIAGWSSSATRRLIRWLYSVNFERITGFPVAFTLTVRDCPDSPDAFKRLWQAYIRHLKDHGISQSLWLIEWQRRGVPHLHGVLVCPSLTVSTDICAAWVKRASRYGAETSGQHFMPVTDARGWSEYLAKHSARGVSHYQRSNRNIPKGWQGKTGRLWGVTGDWPTRDPIDVSCDPRTFFRWRRLIRSYRLSLARHRKDPKAIRYARTMLRHRDRVVSRVRGLSLFIHPALSLLLLNAAAEGRRLEC